MCPCTGCSLLVEVWLPRVGGLKTVVRLQLLTPARPAQRLPGVSGAELGQHPRPPPCSISGSGARLTGFSRSSSPPAFSACPPLCLVLP